MTSRLRKKHLTTVPNINLTVIAACVLRPSRLRLIVLVAVCSCVLSGQGQAQVQAQVQARQVGWTSRQGDLPNRSKTPLTTNVRPTADLPWRPSPKAATQVVPVADFSQGILPAGNVEESTEGDLDQEGTQSLLPTALTLPPIAIRRLQPTEHAAAIASVRQSLIKPRKLPTTLPATHSSMDPFEDPFADRTQTKDMGVIRQEADSEEMSPTALFADPFGDRELEAPESGYELSERLVNLRRIEEDEDEAEPSLRNDSSITASHGTNGYQPRIEIPATFEPDEAIRLHSPSTEFDRGKNVALVVHSATGVTPSLSPTLPQESTLRDVPEFPEYDPGPQKAPTPESIEGNQLPNLPEPPKPDGFSDESVLPIQDDEELPKPDEDAPGEQAEKGEDEPSSESDKTPSNCGRVYNDRDCCDQDENCRKAWDRLNQVTIADIEIDISPPLAPLPEDEADAEALREKLQEAPFREFRNQYGNVVASGTIEDFVNGNVMIRTPEGTLQAIPFRQLGYDDRCFFSAWWGIPNECLIRSNDLGIRDWTMTTFTWKATGVCHKTTFFEDVQLERYGHSAGPVLQPLISGAHFFANIGLFPYNAGVYPPTECHYVLGLYRPGECAPWLVPAFPLSRRGAVLETAGLFGFFGLF